MAEQTERMLDIDGTRIYAVEQGEGPLVLFSHGFPELAYSWRHQLPAVANAGYRAVAIDQRGFGRSSKFWTPESYRIDQLAADLIGVIKAYGESQAVIVGHDWGAPIVWSAAWMHPQYFRGVMGMSVPFSGKGLISVPGNPFGEKPLLEYQKELAGPGLDFYHTYWSTLDTIIDEIESDLRGWISGLMYSVSAEGLSAAGFDLNAAEPIELIRASALCIPQGQRQRERLSKPQPVPWLSEKDLEVYVNAFERSGFHGALSYYRNLPDHQKLLSAYDNKKLEVPAYFLGADLDVATWWGTEARARADEFIVDYRGETILENCGHWMQQERPQQTNEVLIEFLRGLD